MPPCDQITKTCLKSFVSIRISKYSEKSPDCKYYHRKRSKINKKICRSSPKTYRISYENQSKDNIVNADILQNTFKEQVFAYDAVDNSYKTLFERLIMLRKKILIRL